MHIDQHISMHLRVELILKYEKRIFLYSLCIYVSLSPINIWNYNIFFLCWIHNTFVQLHFYSSFILFEFAVVTNLWLLKDCPRQY